MEDALREAYRSALPSYAHDLNYMLNSGEPIPNVAVSVNLLSNEKAGKKKNYAKSFGNCSRSMNDGMASLRLMCGVPYVISASCDGFHK